MRRLSPYQSLALAVDRRAERACRLVAVEGSLAVLQPELPAFSLPPNGVARASLRFMNPCRQEVMLRGWASRGPLEDTLAFAPGAGSRIPQPRAIAWLGLVTTATVDSITHHTKDLSARAIRFDAPLGAPDTSDVDIKLMLPGHDLPLELRGRVAMMGTLVRLYAGPDVRALGTFVLACHQQVARQAASGSGPTGPAPPRATLDAGGADTLPVCPSRSTSTTWSSRSTSPRSSSPSA